MRIFKGFLAAFLLLTAVVLGSVAYHSSRWGSRAAQGAPAPDLISFAPADATYILYADISALRSSPFLDELTARTLPPTTDRDYAEFMRATGFDYARDLDRVVLAGRPGSSANLNVVVAEGRFDRDKISSYALRSGKMERQNGAEVYVLPAGTSGKVVAFAFLDAKRIALADGPSLAPVLVPKTPSAADPAMRDRISRVAGAALFAVGKIGPIPENFSPGGLRSDQFTNLARSLRWVSLGARPEGERLKVAIEGECDTSENARQLAGTLDGLRLLGQAALADPKTRQQIQPESLPLLENLLGAVEVSRPGASDEKRVRLTLELTPEMLRAAGRKKPAPRAP